MSSGAAGSNRPRVAAHHGSWTSGYATTSATVSGSSSKRSVSNRHMPDAAIVLDEMSQTPNSGLPTEFRPNT